MYKIKKYQMHIKNKQTHTLPPLHISIVCKYIYFYQMNKNKTTHIACIQTLHRHIII